MKRILFVISIMLAIVPQASAAFTPAAFDEVASKSPASSYRSVTGGILLPGVKKPTRLQQLALKLTQKKWFQKWMLKADDKQRTKKTLGIIAFVSGVLLIISVLAFPPASLVLAPVAIVTGIMGVSKNPDRKSYTFALIGLIIGLVYALLLLVLLAVALAWVNGW